MKKYLKIFSCGFLLTAFPLVTSSCSPRKIIFFSYFTDYAKAFNIAFKNQENSFSILPNFSVKKNLNLNLDLLTWKDSVLKIDDKKYNVKDSETFIGRGISKEEYNNDDHINKRVQYSLDDIAKWFSIQPFEKKDFIYDFSNLTLKVVYKNNKYFFNKLKNNEQLVFWSSQCLTIQKESNEIRGEGLYFFDDTIFLNKKIIEKFLNVVCFFENNKQENQNKLVITFKYQNDKLDSNYKQTAENEIKDFFNYYQNNLKFKEENNEFISENLNPFIIDEQKINVIKINFEKGENK